MKVFVERTQEQREIEFSGTVKELLEKLDINPETVIVSRDDELVTGSDTIQTGDNIKILSVISGG
jgi:thiamine biosynthesis protein ThiS